MAILDIAKGVYVVAVGKKTEKKVALPVKDSSLDRSSHSGAYMIVVPMCKRQCRM